VDEVALRLAFALPDLRIGIVIESGLDGIADDLRENVGWDGLSLAGLSGEGALIGSFWWRGFQAQRYDLAGEGV
jgi:hypothetical protein